MYGFISIGKGVDNVYRYIQKIDCKDGNIEVKYGYEEYNSVDEEIIKSDKHCLRYFYSYSLDPYNFKEKYPSDNDCFNADLLQTSKDAGLKCGYSEFNLKYVSGKSEVYKTCYIYNPDIVNTKIFDDISTVGFDAYAQDIATREEETLLSYSINLSDDSGNKISYDSLTRQVTVPSSSSRRRSSSKGTKDYKSNYLLFLLILILL